MSLECCPVGVDPFAKGVVGNRIRDRQPSAQASGLGDAVGAEPRGVWASKSRRESPTICDYLVCEVSGGKTRWKLFGEIAFGE